MNNRFNCCITIFLYIFIHYVSGQLPKYYDIYEDEPAAFRHTLFELSRPFVILAERNTNISVECQRDSQLYLKNLEDLELWALQMFDSTGKFPSGFLNGNAHITGDMKTCLKIIPNNLPQDYQQFQGKFCIAKIFFEPVTKSEKIIEIVDRIQSHRAFTAKFEDDTNCFPHTSEITWGFCIPSSCTNVDLENFLHEFIKPYNHTIGVEIKLRVKPKHCQILEPIKVELSTAIFIIILICVCIISTVAFIYDYKYKPYETISDLNKEPVLTQILYAYSPRRNWKLLFHVDKLEDDIKCLHGIRTIFSLLIYFIHKTSFKYYLPLANRTEAVENSEGKASMIIRAFSNHVDTFAILSGLLTSYFAFRKLQQGRKLNILSMYIARYLKFAPTYFIILHLNAQIFQPITPTSLRILERDSIVPENSAWRRIFFVENLFGINKMLYVSAHQLFVDFQLYLTSPFLILLLWTYSKHVGKLLVGLITVFSALKAYTVYCNGYLLAIYFGQPIKHLEESSDGLYLNPIQRMVPYLFGIGLGYYLRIYKRPTLNRNTQIIGWIIALICLYYSFFGLSEISNMNYKYNRFDATVYSTLQPITWACVICWTIFTCHYGYSYYLNNILSWGHFIIFSKISYGFYILQLQVMFLSILSNNVPKYNRQLFDLFDLNEFTLLIGYSIAFTMFCLFPTGHLYLIWKNRSIAKNKQISDTNEDFNDINNSDSNIKEKFS